MNYSRENPDRALIDAGYSINQTNTHATLKKFFLKSCHTKRFCLYKERKLNTSKTMENILRGLTYSYGRNVGWQDRTIRAIFGLICLGGTIYFYSTNFKVAAILGALFLAQLITVTSSRCVICFFLGRCTITGSEKSALRSRNIRFEDLKSLLN